MPLAALPARADLFRYPLAADKGTVTAYFDHGGQDWNCGSKRYSGHKGSDFGAGKGTPVFAAADGTVVYINDGCSDTCTSGSCGCGGGFGNYVKVQHADGNHTYYAHMEIWSVQVQVNQKVSCSQHLGNVASSGNSTGNHLHFEVRVPTTSQDPFSGPCSGSTSMWISQGPYLGHPGIQCSAPPPPDSGPPKPDSKPPAPDAALKPDSKPVVKIDGAGTVVDGQPPATDGTAGLPPVWPEAPTGQALQGGCDLGRSNSRVPWPWLLLGLLIWWRRR